MAIATITRVASTDGWAAQPTTRPGALRGHFLNSAAVWLALMAYWAAADLILAAFPPGGRPVQAETWQTFALSRLLPTLAGLAAIWCMARTGFPVAWDVRIPARRRLLLPLLVGAGGGLLAIGVELVGRASRAIEAGSGEPLNVAFPGSLLYYSAGAIGVELVYLLLPVPVLLWLISGVLLRGRGQGPTFWALAVISSAAEPLLQGTAVLAMAGGGIGPGIVALYAAESFAHNFASASLFRRYSLLAAILVRLGHYLIWHVLYGNFLV